LIEKNIQENNKCHIPKSTIFFPEGSLELERVETSLRIEDLKHKTNDHRSLAIRDISRQGL